jgi:hypothetical protein
LDRVIIQTQTRLGGLHDDIVFVGALRSNACWIGLTRNKKQGPSAKFLKGKEAGDLKYVKLDKTMAIPDEVILVQPFRELWRRVRPERGDDQEPFVKKVRQLFKSLAYWYLLQSAVEDSSNSAAPPVCTSPGIIDALKKIGEGEPLENPIEYRTSECEAPDGGGSPENAHTESKGKNDLEFVVWRRAGNAVNHLIIWQRNDQQEQKQRGARITLSPDISCVFSDRPRSALGHATPSPSAVEYPRALNSTCRRLSDPSFAIADDMIRPDSLIESSAMSESDFSLKTIPEGSSAEEPPHPLRLPSHRSTPPTESPKTSLPAVFQITGDIDYGKLQFFASQAEESQMNQRVLSERQKSKRTEVEMERSGVERAINDAKKAKRDVEKAKSDAVKAQRDLENANTERERAERELKEAEKEKDERSETLKRKVQELDEVERLVQSLEKGKSRANKKIKELASKLPG